MRIASFNLDNLAEGDLAAARRKLLRQQIQRLDADILCLQEVDGDKPRGAGPRRLSALEALIASTPYQDFHRATTTQPGTDAPRDRHNLVVMSRWPITTCCELANELVPSLGYMCVTGPAPTPEGQILWDRPILAVEIAIPGGQPLHIINMHLKAPTASAIAGQKIGPFAWKSVSAWAEGYFLAAVKRAGQALEARLLVDRIFDAEEEALIAVCGDFNAEERDIAVHIVAGRTEDTGNGHLVGRELIALEHGLPESQRFTVIHAGRHQMLDHIVVSRPLLSAYRGIEIHNEALGDELVAYTTVNHSLESFHAPVVATFDLTVKGDP